MYFYACEKTIIENLADLVLFARRNYFPPCLPINRSFFIISKWISLCFLVRKKHMGEVYFIGNGFLGKNRI